MAIDRLGAAGGCIDDGNNSPAGAPCPLDCDGGAQDNGSTSSSSPTGVSSPICCDDSVVHRD
uniref:Uncharacterized protein n=1 Tax=Oryza sativa subsp. japonica TaxID=39947 RepID=Q6EPK3_ORYSJ|nr:hypothetical protein [Oryza sativa Japonica Group]